MKSNDVFCPKCKSYEKESSVSFVEYDGPHDDRLFAMLRDGKMKPMDGFKALEYGCTNGHIFFVIDVFCNPNQIIINNT